jgi:hypothetical protein
MQSWRPLALLPATPDPALTPAQVQLSEALNSRAALEKNVRSLFEAERMELEKAARDARATAADQVEAANEQVRGWSGSDGEPETG